MVTALKTREKSLRPVINKDFILQSFFTISAEERGNQVIERRMDCLGNVGFISIDFQGRQCVMLCNILTVGIMTFLIRWIPERGIVAVTQSKGEEQ
jgi:hypothetical protein